MQMNHLTDAERMLPRAQRRAIQASRRTLIKKRVPFGRVAVMALELGEAPRDERVVYKHFTKGVMDRRATTPLYGHLLSGAGF